MRISYFIIALVMIMFSFGCQKKIEVIRGKNKTYYFQPVEAGVESVTEVKWPVGPLRRQRVSKGIRLRINFPKFKDHDLQELVDKREVDSWLIRLRKEGFASSEILGRVFVPLYTSGGRVKKFRLSQRKDGIFLIYYSAAATSPRFANFMCPAFGHRYEIQDTMVTSGHTRERPIKVGSSEEKSLLYEAKEFSYEPPIFNAGTDMEATYFLEVALFNSVKKKILSSFTPLERAARVKGEEKVEIKGCENFKIPGPEEENDKVKQFKFGG